MADTTTKATWRGFWAACPKCGERTVQVSLADVNNLFCTQCEEEVDLEGVRRLVSDWAEVLKWLDSAPVMADDE